MGLRRHPRAPRPYLRHYCESLSEDIERRAAARHLVDTQAPRRTASRADVWLHSERKKVSQASRANGSQWTRSRRSYLWQSGKNGAGIYRMRTPLWRESKDCGSSRFRTYPPEWMAQIPPAPHASPHEAD